MPSPGPAHAATVAHRGAFAHASCETCGWLGAARRSLARARLDAEAHLLLGPTAADDRHLVLDLRNFSDAAPPER